MNCFNHPDQPAIPLVISGEKGTIFIGVMGLVFLITGLLRLRSKAKYPEVK